MPVLRKSTSDETPHGYSKTITPPVKPSAKASPTPGVISLPTEPDEPVDSMSDASWLIYGEPKIGKTSLASMFPNAIFLMFEPGGDGLRIMKRDVNSWAEFQQYVKLICASPKEQYSTPVIDTVDKAYDMCFKAVCKTMGVDHPSEGNFGDVWKAIESEFTRQMDLLLKSGRGVIFTSHVDDKEFSKRTGGNYSKLVPSMSKAARTYIKGTCDIIGYYGYYGDERFFTIQGSDELDAGNRLKYRFWCKGYPERKERVHSIPMTNDEEESFANLVKAFNNEQQEPCNPDDEATISEMPAKKKQGGRR